MEMALRLCHRLQQTITLEQKLEQKLQLTMKPPSGWVFDEPEPRKRIEEVDGKPVIRISKSELASYVEAVRTVSEIIDNACPNIVLVSMRGALPLFRATMQSMNPKYLDRESDDVYWEERRFSRTVITEKPPDRILGAFAKDEKERSRLIREYGSRKTFRFRAVKAKTSYFLEGMSENVQEGLISAFGHCRAKEVISAVFIDTSVTGKKLSWFLPQFMDSVRQVADIVGRTVHIMNVILNHGKPGETSSCLVKHEGGRLYSSRFDIGVESVITEDSPTLLGAYYTRHEITPEAIDVIGACEFPKRASLVIANRRYDIADEPTGTTAALFARVVGNEARNA